MRGRLEISHLHSGQRLTLLLDGLNSNNLSSISTCCCSLRCLCAVEFTILTKKFMSMNHTTAFQIEAKDRSNCSFWKRKHKEIKYEYYQTVAMSVGEGEKFSSPRSLQVHPTLCPLGPTFDLFSPFTLTNPHDLEPGPIWDSSSNIHLLDSKKPKHC